MNSTECKTLSERIVELALSTLPRMVLPDQAEFGFGLAKDLDTPQFTEVFSRRYTMMCLLGLHRAVELGHRTSIDLGAIGARVVSLASTFGAGDLGILLWFCSKHRPDDAAAVADELEKRLGQCSWDHLEGMQIGWILTGEALFQGRFKRVLPNASRVVDYFLTNRVAPSGLIRHTGTGFRSRFPNYATQIYSVYAMATRVKELGDSRAAKAGTKLATKLFELQQTNGGWPWLYDAERGTVVEPFEVYSVHQHAMGPMALFELAEACGTDVAGPVIRSMDWLLARNELQFDMIDLQRGLIWRSIRRTSPWHRIELYRRTFASRTGLTANDDSPAGKARLEINATCRSYELGWLLEAWCRKSLPINT